MNFKVIVLPEPFWVLKDLVRPGLESVMDSIDYLLGIEIFSANYDQFYLVFYSIQN